MIDVYPIILIGFQIPCWPSIPILSTDRICILLEMFTAFVSDVIMEILCLVETSPSFQIQREVFTFNLPWDKLKM